MYCGQHTKDEPGCERNCERKEKNRGIQVDRVEPEHVAGPKDEDPARQRMREHESERAGGHSKQEALCQKLRHDAPSRRAERRTDGDLSFTPRRAREKQIRDVGAGNQ